MSNVWSRARTHKWKALKRVRDCKLVNGCLWLHAALCAYGQLQHIVFSGHRWMVLKQQQRQQQQRQQRNDRTQERTRRRKSEQKAQSSHSLRFNQNGKRFLLFFNRLVLWDSVNLVQLPLLLLLLKCKNLTKFFSRILVNKFSTICQREQIHSFFLLRHQSKLLVIYCDS